MKWLGPVRANHTVARICFCSCVAAMVGYGRFLSREKAVIISYAPRSVRFCRGVRPEDSHPFVYRRSSALLTALVESSRGQNY